MRKKQLTFGKKYCKIEWWLKVSLIAAAENSCSLKWIKHGLTHKFKNANNRCMGGH
jgi:hypothetical protein